MTPEQLERLHAALAVKTDDRAIAAAIEEAKLVIRDLARTEACVTYESSSALNRYAAPDIRLSYALPMEMMRYHNKSTCVSVLRIHGWRLLARNAFEFEIAYVADDSGESFARRHEVVKQPSGEWLFTR